MRRHRRICLVCGLVAGAALFVTSVTCGGGEGPPPTGENLPFRDEWRVEFTAPFPYDAQAEAAGIERILIGEPFPNLGAQTRGDVIVLFDAAPATIEVEMRRFTFAGDTAEAQEQFDRVSVLAVDEQGRDCTERWWDRCTLTTAYDGITQPVRDGADFRVHLPPDFHHRIIVHAFDVSEDVDYPDRGNVCIEAFAGDAEVLLDSGAVFVTLSDATTPAPLCVPSELDACLSQDWGGDCACPYGVLRVATRDLQKASVSVDVPPGLWTTMSLTNVDTEGESCDLSLDVPGTQLKTETQQHLEGEAGRPDGAKLGSEGYGIELRSLQCGVVGWVSGPDQLGEATEERRGDLRVCSGCLAGASCEELLADL
jgi:hypothetical protein